MFTTFYLTFILLVALAGAVWFIHWQGKRAGKVEAERETALKVLENASKAKKIEQDVADMPIDAARRELYRDASE